MGRDCVWCENALIECELWKKIISNEEIKLRRSCCYDVVRCSVPMLYCLTGGCVQLTSWCSYSKLVSPRRWFDDSKLGLWTISMRRKTMLWRWLLHLMACGWWRCPTQGHTLLNYQSLPSSRFSPFTPQTIALSHVSHVHSFMKIYCQTIRIGPCWEPISYYSQ